MSIRKILVCPFCKSDMKRYHGGTCKYDGAIIITVQEEVSIDSDRGKIQIQNPKEDIHLEMYICECGFVAFWRGEL